jgi:hypothetical protein
MLVFCIGVMVMSVLGAKDWQNPADLLLHNGPTDFIHVFDTSSHF